MHTNILAEDITSPRESVVDARLADRGRSRPELRLPLVSVIVVNYCYGRFLDDAVGSVFGQTYPNLECILVDNASIDESPAIIERLEAEYPSMKVVRRSSNDGQTAASLDGLAEANGQYVIFLDADDFLLPACVDRHIYAHLSMRNHIAFTSGDMLQVVGNDVVLATGAEFNRFVRSGKGAEGMHFRAYVHEGLPSWPSESLKADVDGRIRYVPPRQVSWIWSPTSGLCYRRDALLLFADNPALPMLRTGTDMYFALGSGALSGSALVDVPVFAYRIHASNVFTQRAQLDSTLCFASGGNGDNNTNAQFLLIDHLTATSSRYSPMFHLALNYLGVCLKLDISDNNKTLPRWARRSRLAQGIVTNYEAFSASVGPVLARIVLAWSAKSFLQPSSLLKALLMSR